MSFDSSYSDFIDVEIKVGGGRRIGDEDDMAESYWRFDITAVIDGWDYGQRTHKQGVVAGNLQNVITLMRELIATGKKLEGQTA